MIREGLMAPFTVRCLAAAVLAMAGATARGQPSAALLPPAGGPDAPRFFAGSAGPYAVTAQNEHDVQPGTESQQLPADAPGWFGAVTLGLVRSHLSGDLVGGPGLPFGRLDWTVLPRIEVGYRLPEGAGAVRLGYHVLSASGSASAMIGGSDTHVDLNALDLDYVSSEWAAGAPDWCRDLRAVAGLRLADATLKAAGPFWSFRSEFDGAGPRFGLEWRRPVPVAWPVEAYVRAEATGLVGRTRQTIGYVPVGAGQWNGAAAVLAEVGVGWRPDWLDGLRVAAGYQLEQWWNLGRTDAANVELVVHGLFVRAEWRY